REIERGLGLRRRAPRGADLAGQRGDLLVADVAGILLLQLLAVLQDDLRLEDVGGAALLARPGAVGQHLVAAAVDLCQDRLGRDLGSLLEHHFLDHARHPGRDPDLLLRLQRADGVDRVAHVLGRDLADLDGEGALPSAAGASDGLGRAGRLAGGGQEEQQGDRSSHRGYLTGILPWAFSSWNQSSLLCSFDRSSSSWADRYWFWATRTSRLETPTMPW